MVVLDVVPFGIRCLQAAAELPAGEFRLQELRDRARLPRAIPADLCQFAACRLRGDDRPARHVHAGCLRLCSPQFPRPRRAVLHPPRRPDVPGAGDDPADLSGLCAGRPDQPADRPRADVPDVELRRLPDAPVHAEPAQGTRGSRLDGRRQLSQDLLAHLSPAVAACPFGARHHHLHPDLELLFPGARPARQGTVHDLADRHGPAARLPRIRQPFRRHGRNEHVDPAGRAALPRSPALRHRGDHDERHQELRTLNAQTCRTDFMWDDLASVDPRFAYKGERTRYIAFPLGGVGSGGFSISGNGRLIDWSIRNRPALQGYNGYSHFAIKAEKDGRLVDARVLNGPYDLNPSGAPGLRKMFDGFGHGANRQTLVGVPHFREVDFYGRFPTADLVFKDDRFPGGVRLTALSPFIPHNDRDSAMPAGMFEFEIVNDTKDELIYTLAGTLGNYGSNSGIHAFRRQDGVSALHLTSSEADLKPAERGDLTIATDAED